MLLSLTMAIIIFSLTCILMLINNLFSYKMISDREKTPPLNVDLTLNHHPFLFNFS